MRATFEEKTYENYFNTELGKMTQIYFPLGQVSEGKLGFDSSAYSRNIFLWRNLPYRSFFRRNYKGATLREMADMMESYLQVEIKNVPDMKTNLLFQYKKPEYISSKNGKEWNLWGSEYYRYDIDPNQQTLLMNMHTSFKNEVLILYASPALKDVNELVKAYKKKKIIKKSNFTEVHKLNNHHRNTYLKEGKISIACSEPENIENTSLLDLIRKKQEDEESINRRFNIDNEEFIVNFVKRMVSVIQEDKIYKSSFRELTEELKEIQEYRLTYSLMNMNVINNLTGLQWLISVNTH
ncbi:hypothetical protein [Paenibacillus sp. QZ-Y1]|uniref:hypothetical protein n=1 Tax=Paenibacillus sp. QZ-Y1 TaxID=3414511 RepID=UPI003F7AA15D